MKKGTVAWMSPRGYGFIHLEGCGSSVYAPAHLLHGLKTGHGVMVKVVDGFLGRSAEELQLDHLDGVVGGREDVAAA